MLLAPNGEDHRKAQEDIEGDGISKSSCCPNRRRRQILMSTIPDDAHGVRIGLVVCYVGPHRG